MAFVLGNMTKIANLLSLVAKTDPTPGLWYYVTTDTMATVMGAGYFNAATSLVEGAIIEVIGANGRQAVQVASNIAGVVVVTNLATTARGQATTVTAADTIVTGLAGPLTGVVATEDSDLVLTAAYVSATIGNQAGAPASGSFILKSWEPTSNANPTPIAATTFGKKVNWFAF